MERQNYDSRWPPALVLFAMLAVVALLPMRLTLMPQLSRFALAAVALLPTVAVAVTSGSHRSLVIERMAHFAFYALVTLLTLFAVAQLIYMMVRRSSELSGLTLLLSSIAVWLVIIGINSILYWQLDRGGPEARLRGLAVHPDWLFPQDNASAVLVRANWRPNFVDYFYLAYSTATSFSTNEVVPLTSRAKLLMMLESIISLMVIVLVGARAINILGA